MSKEEKESVIPDVIYDEKNGNSYLKGRFFGRGGFGTCYQILETKTQAVFAAKIVDTKMMKEHSYRERMTQEIAIHRSLNHVNIVKFYSHFRDIHNIYIILELCKKGSMTELHERRKTLTEYETRYFMKQILDGVDYLHKNCIIHRDLKLRNLFLNDELQVKIGDFGLATKLEYVGERKKTICGTPNYIAPEILTKVGHSYEVDVWSIGCIMYTLLVGKPPFETSTLRETYARIKQVQYKTPTDISTSAITMISNTLQGNPSKRPSVAKLLKDSFMMTGFMPQSLPLSCLTMAPRLDTLETYNQRRPLSEMNQCFDAPMFRVPEPSQKPDGSADPQKTGRDMKRMLSTLKDQVGAVLSSKPGRQNASSAIEMTDPSAQPFLWVSKWVDYSDKYGFGYQLSDDGVGVMYNDGTKLIMLSNKYNIHYINHEGREFYYTVKDYPLTLERKMKLIHFFLQYMNEYLMKAAGSVVGKRSDWMSRIPYIYQWSRTQTALLMLLTNGSVQINFRDHTKIIMCPLMAAVTYFDQKNNFKTYRFTTIQRNGCTAGLEKQLLYAFQELTRMSR